MIKHLVRYFLAGLVVAVLVILTGYLLYSLVIWLDNILQVHLLKFFFPGLGIILTIIGLTTLGFTASIFITKPLFEWFDSLLSQIPGVKFIYTAIKDVMDAFVGDKKKFTEPVAVEMSTTGILKLGFVTEKDLTHFLDADGADKYVAVYFPHSYNFSGNLFLVPKENVKHLDTNSTDLMKFVVSGGVTKSGEQSKLNGRDQDDLK